MIKATYLQFSLTLTRLVPGWKATITDGNGEICGEATEYSRGDAVRYAFFDWAKKPNYPELDAIHLRRKYLGQE